ncbi:hypothetical protein N781_12835 [Pontibacillus halophilus JSM 076056 = DSM 19796]|uniref:Uncharacterized protein n=1 Tax=Pontibacillus halophilus JSM 076056 = DSM 19796 TaxID=1385510 RepID=A0A0A5GJ48_9BACI|nr:hypothetical protein [Pontibacillus halophilus]KGX93286.1 hypothetical protein N781_12835 [Pontibacillus halophilus JSM 076056 = DSM 19796]
MYRDELDRAWFVFLSTLNRIEPLSVSKRMITGIPFVFIEKHHTKLQKTELDDYVKKAAAKAMKGKRLTLSMSFVRENETFIIYRVRFLVPQRKMFCCGNLCVDCIRFQP